MCKFAFTLHIVYLFSFLGAILTFHLLHIETMSRTKQNVELQQALQLNINAIVTNPAFVNGISMPLIFSPINTPNFGVNQNIGAIGLNVQSPSHHQNHSIGGIGLNLPPPPPHHNHFSHSNQIDSVDINLNSNFTDRSSNLNSLVSKTKRIHLMGNHFLALFKCVFYWFQFKRVGTKFIHTTIEELPGELEIRELYDFSIEKIRRLQPYEPHESHGCLLCVDFNQVPQLEMLKTLINEWVRKI